MTQNLDYSAVLDAARRIASYASYTPVMRSRRVDRMTGATLYFKCEHLQRSGAFKFRGACNAVWSLPEQQSRLGVVTHSSGNHGAALALAASTRGMVCHVVVPDDALASKRANIERNGASLWRCRAGTANREAACAQLQQRTGATLVHPYADPAVIAGQGTAAFELIEQAGGLDTLVVPVGGGGLAAGSLLVTQQHGVELMLAAPVGAADAALSLQSGQRRLDVQSNTLCDGLRTYLGEPNFELLYRTRVPVLTVDDRQTVAAMRLIWQVLKQLVEPSSAITLAAILANPQRFGGRRVGVLLSGGNVDLDALPW